jgi:hypothetical protein
MPKCRNPSCRSEFQRMRPLQAVCSGDCGHALVVAMRAKELAAKANLERAQDRAKLEAWKKVPKLIAEVQKEFNAFIRERDKGKVCFVCCRPFDASIPGRAMHAGHVRSRGAAGHLRFHEDNCHGECEGCNGPHGAKPHQIEAGAIARIGQERYDALKADNTTRKWQKDELRELKKTYSAKRRELMKEVA